MRARGLRHAQIVRYFLTFRRESINFPAIASLEVQRIGLYGFAKQHLISASGVARSLLIRRRVTGLVAPSRPDRGRYLPRLFHRVVFSVAGIPGAFVFVCPERVAPLLCRKSHQIESRSAVPWPRLPGEERDARPGEPVIAPFFIDRKPEGHAT
jgi:hypothetical protein